MLRLDREQAISVAAFVLLLLVSVTVMGMSLQARADAVRESSERREMLSRLEARLRVNAGRPTAAPPAAFLDASTPGLASAQLQSYLGQLAGDKNASLVSSGGEAAKRDDAPDTVRVQATLDMNLQSLRAVLYQLESGTPYVFVDALAVQPDQRNSGAFRRRSASADHSEPARALAARCAVRHSRPRATFSLLLLSALIFSAAARTEEQGRAAAPLANPVAAQPLEQLPAIVDRSLFSPSRRPPAAPPPPVVQAPAASAQPVRTAQRYSPGCGDGRPKRPRRCSSWRGQEIVARADGRRHRRLEGSPDRWAQSGVGVAGRPLRHLQALQR